MRRLLYPEHTKLVLFLFTTLFVGASSLLAQQNAMTCNVSLQVSVDQNCSKLIFADDLLEGDPDPGITYFIMLKKNNQVVESGPAPLLVDGIADSGAPYIYINRTLVAEIFAGDPSTGNVNSCWTSLTFEDKLAPVITGQQVFNVSCLENLDCITAPTVSDNCGTTTLNVSDVTVLSDLCTGVVVERTYVAFDSYGNVSDPFVVTINVSQAPVVFPRDIEWTCQQYAAYPTVTDPTPRSSCIFDTFDDDGDGILTNLDDDDDDPLTLFDNDDDPITVGLVVGADDASCLPAGEQDSADGSGCSSAVCNLTVSAGGTGISCTSPGVLGLEDDDVLERSGSGTPNIYDADNSDFCRYNVTFEDDTLSVCAGASGVFKIIREWRVLNWCSMEVLTDQQLIAVTDKISPVVILDPMIDLTANVAGSGYTSPCGSSGLLPVPELFDDCSGIDTASIQVSTPIGQATPVVQNGVLIGYQIPSPYLGLGGPYTITYVLADKCGNQTVTTTQVVVLDRTPPTAVCDEITNLSLTTTATTAIFAQDLDDGSNDDCNQVYFKVIRMDELTANSAVHSGLAINCNQANSEDNLETGNAVYFDDEAFFCCEDIPNNNQLVIVRVYDVDPGDGAVDPSRHGLGGDLFQRYNDCMVEIEIEDKIAPVKLLDAPDRTFSCTDAADRQQYADASAVDFDAPVFADNCDFTVSLTVIDGTGPCGDGLIRRRFQATDAFGNASVICEQRINFFLEHDYSIQWGNDFDGPTSAMAMVLADTLSDADFTEGPCDLLFVSHSDQISSVPSDPCKTKILRTTEVINWCEWDGVSDAIEIQNPSNTDAGPLLTVSVGPGSTNEVRINGILTPLSSVGRWKYTQVLVFSDPSVDPIITLVTTENCTDGITAPNPSGLACGGPVRATFEVTDGCVNTGAAIGYFAVIDFDDANGNGEFDMGEGTVLSGANEIYGSLTQQGTSVVIEGTYPLGQLALVASTGGPSFATAIISVEDCLGAQPLYDISLVENCNELRNQTPPVVLGAIPNPNGLLCGGQARITGQFLSPCVSAIDYYLVTGVTDTNGDGLISNDELSTGTSFQGATDPDPNGVFALAGNGVDFTISGTYPLGLNAVVITAVDGISVTQEILSFEGLDCVRPEARTTTLPLGISISQTNGLLLTPEDLDAATPSEPNAGSRDNCGMPVVLEIKRLSDPDSDFSTVGVNLTCADILVNSNNETVVLIDFRVTDQAGNQTEVTLEIPAFCTQPRSVSGRISDLQGEGVENTRITTSGGYLNSFTTAADGLYVFTDIDEGTDLTIQPINDLGVHNGVTTLDLYYIGQHILGRIPFAFDQQYFAADANMSGSVSAYDMTVLRRLILGLDAQLPNGVPSWRFFDYGFAPTGDNPLSQNWPETITITEIEDDLEDLDFMAVKVGDVNGSARANLRQPLAPRTQLEPFYLQAEDQLLQPGETTKVSFRTGQQQMIGYQASLQWDPAQLELVDVTGVAHPSAGFGRQQIDQGVLTMSHEGSLADELFILTVRAKDKPVRLSTALASSSAITTAEAYSPQGVHPVALQFGGRIQPTGTTLAQNIPNPFSGETAIPFSLAQSGPATLVFTDAAGREVYRTSADYAAGAHNVWVTAGLLGGRGLYSYTLIAGDYVATRKLVIID